MAKELKKGLNAGGGRPPGYLWSVHYLSVARAEAMDFLNDEQYAHVTDLLRTLASEVDPTHALMVTVQGVEDFYELKDKGGLLGKINLRVFFTVLFKEKAIVVVGAIKKEAEGQTPVWAKSRIRFRLRRFKGGDFGFPA